MGTIYRQLLTGNKHSDLEPLWTAAHFPKRIKKHLVEQTNIISSVDRILVDQVPTVTYRILGFLLLGVARIYSKKVDYLLIDSNKSLNEVKYYSEGRRKVNINVAGLCLPESSSHRSKQNVVDVPESGSSTKKKSNTFVEAMRAQFSSISLPENFELDAFDLEIVEDDSSNDHVKPHLELVLNDAWENDQTRHHMFGKDRGDVYARSSDHASTSTSAMITNINTSNSEKSREKFRHRFSLDDIMDPMVLDETDEEVELAVIPLIEPEPEPEPECDNINSSDKHPDEECTTGQTLVSEMTSVDNIILKLKPSPDKHPLLVSIDATPQSKAAVVSDDAHKSDVVAVRTPASKNDARAPRKRKCDYDEAVKIPKEVYRGWVEDASDLVCKRRKAPSALLACTRSCFDYFLEPIIPINAGFPSDLNPVISTKELVLEEEVEANQIINELELELELEPLKSCEEREAETMAPSTPVTQSTSGLRFHEVHETSRVNPASSSETETETETREKEQFPIRDVHVGLNEGPSSLGEENGEIEKWSAVTKSVAGYLHDKFVNRREKGEEEAAVKLSRILKQKTKKESARFFYQILVLKTGGFIDVKQEKPYDEICVMQSPLLGEVFGAGS